ncbi:SAM-dependent methyltransferase [Allocatelliglobosispora scoriae]|uniref:SAM-dependent methyltransferase n=1 Tax=Allocatelliglobosispora scoriae TaxID=643052 RepID=A0A841BR80_9ACTN|nr:class I SAM-dependent methyltransferase [Allocatelliglobosispora scoriae]MBB5870744.1 SAM-dependent methyltransferase [Allocatelliglobosispora scoriae]
MTSDEHRLAFGAAASLYDRARPTYPAEALTWTFAPLGAGPLRVVDLGAGTGLLTRVLLAAGHEVIPVEPDAGMRAALAAATPGVTALAGSAEEIPLPDGSVDAVVAGTAYHWFVPERAHPEVARVLRPGGVFAPIWNDRDTTEDWTMKLAAIMRSYRGSFERRHELDRTMTFGDLFGPVVKAEFRHAVPQTPQGLADLIASRSYYLVADEARRQEMLDDVAALCATHPDLAGRTAFDLPYVTAVYRAVRH